MRNGDERMKDIHWLVNRLKSMNAPEVAWRVQQKLLQKREKKSVYSLHLPVTQIPLSKGMQGLRADAFRIPFNSKSNNTSVFETLDIFGQFDYQLYKKKWNAGFQTENTWPEKDFSADIAIGQREDIGDIRTNWELNRHFQFTCLAKNYYITGEERYLSELTDMFNDWNRHNLFLHGAQWTSAMELGIRVISWIYTYVFLTHALEKYQAGESKLPGKLCHGIAVMAAYICKHRARFSSANNHLVVEMLAVGMSGFLFEKEDWIQTSVQILTDELPKQNFEDGVNREMSLHYQSFVMEAYGILWLAMKHNHREVPDSWKTYLTAMSRFVADCCGDYGEVIVFGDNDEGKNLDLQGRIDDHYRYVLQLMGMLLDTRFTKADLIENICWITTEAQQKAYNEKSLYIPGLVSHYQKGGYTILRSRDRKVLIGMDHAELGFGSIAAHGHADALSVQVYFEGRPILVDSGTYNYHVPKKARNEIRSTKAHNTVYIEGIEQADMLGPFLWGRRYQVNDVQIRETDKDVQIEATISYEGITHTRKATFDFGRMLLVDDVVMPALGGASQMWIINGSGSVAGNRVAAEHIAIVAKDATPEVERTVFSPEYCRLADGCRICIPLASGRLSTVIEINQKSEEKLNEL